MRQYKYDMTLVSLGSISSDGSLTLRNSRDFSSGAATFTNYGTLDCGTNIFSNSGNFTNSDSAWLITASPEGIVSSGNSGSIQSSGTRTFHTGGKYHYNGTSAQVTGNGLPATVRNLKIGNSTGVTLNSGVNVTDTLALSEGAFTTGANVLTLGTSAGSVGTLTRTNGKIIGNFKRWLAASTVDDVLFPLGTADHYRPVNLRYTSAPSGGTLTASFTASNPGSSGLPLSNGGYTVNTVSPDGYWTISAADGLSGGTYDLDITAEGFGGIMDYSALRILKRADSESAWTLNGSHLAGTGSNAIPVLHRSGLSGFSDFGVGSNSNDNSLPVTLTSFTGIATKAGVLLKWTTESETENLGFIIEKRLQVSGDWLQVADYITFEALAGHGSTSEAHEYAFTDAAVVPGVTYLYRLADVDYSGKVTYHREVEVKVEVESTQVPLVFGLKPAYPNPFNPIVTIPYGLTEDGNMTLKVFNLRGQLVKTLINTNALKGAYSYTWQPRNLSAGIYIIQLQSGNQTNLQKVVFVK